MRHGRLRHQLLRDTTRHSSGPARRSATAVFLLARHRLCGIRIHYVGICPRTCWRSSSAAASARHRGCHRCAVWAVAGRGATVRVCVCGNMHPLMVARSAVAIVLVAFAMLLARRHFTGNRCDVRHHVRHVERLDHDRPRHGAARTVWPRRVRPFGRTARAARRWCMQSIAPVTLALVIERISDRGALALMAFCAATAFTAFLLAHRRTGGGA